MINLIPRFYINLQSDVHLYSTVHYDFSRGEKAIRVKLHVVPHYCLGRILSFEDVIILIFFPRIFYLEKETNFPGRGDSKPLSLL
jgi:hypothetical protein